jgi:hypothetical protein
VLHEAECAHRGPDRRKGSVSGMTLGPDRHPGV